VSLVYLLYVNLDIIMLCLFEILIYICRSIIALTYDSPHEQQRNEAYDKIHRGRVLGLPEAQRGHFISKALQELFLSIFRHGNIVTITAYRLF